MQKPKRAQRFLMPDAMRRDPRHRPVRWPKMTAPERQSLRDNRFRKFNEWLKSGIVRAARQFGMLRR